MAPLIDVGRSAGGVRDIVRNCPLEPLGCGYRISGTPWTATKGSVPHFQTDLLGNGDAIYMNCDECESFIIRHLIPSY